VAKGKKLAKGQALDPIV